MKHFLLALLAFAQPAIGNAADVVITRFESVVPNGRVAELCGVVRSFPKKQSVKAIVDYNTPYRSTYVIPVDLNGDFCSVVATRYGRVWIVLDEFELFTEINTHPLP